MAEKLTQKQQDFAQHYITCHNAKEAALKAGYSITYSESKAYLLLKNETIKAKIEEFEKEFYFIPVIEFLGKVFFGFRFPFYEIVETFFRVLHLVEAGCVSVNLLSVVFLEKPLFIGCLVEPVIGDAVLYDGVHRIADFLGCPGGKSGGVCPEVRESA